VHAELAVVESGIVSRSRRVGCSRLPGGGVDGNDRQRFQEGWGRAGARAPQYPMLEAAGPPAAASLARDLRHLTDYARHGPAHRTVHIFDANGARGLVCVLLWIGALTADLADKLYGHSAFVARKGRRYSPQRTRQIRGHGCGSSSTPPFAC